MGRFDHQFKFKASAIAEAASTLVAWHEGRKKHWEGEYEAATKVVEDTIGAKLVRQPVTDGFQISVVVDYGDKDAYERMQQAFRKIELHRDAIAEYEAAAQVYSTQGDRDYELDLVDVAFYKLGGEEPED